MGGGALRQPFQTNTFVSPWGSRTAAQTCIPVHMRAAHGRAGWTPPLSLASWDLAVTLNPASWAGVSHTRKAAQE